MKAENKRISHFVILKEIGRGGFGTVYLARDEEIDKYVALKKVENFFERKHERRGIDCYKKNRESFLAQNIISIYETIKVGGDMYYAMPLADGMGGAACTEPNYAPKTLELAIKDRLQKGKGWFSKDEILSIAIPIARALEAIGRCGLKHRDIKPSNIIFIKGKPMISDFGLAAQDAQSLSRAGTADYTPPEWFRKSGGDPDMWGFAMTFYTLFSGMSPSESKDAKNKYPQNWSEEDLKSRKKTWDEFYKIVFKVKQDRQEDRFPNWQSLLEELSAISRRRQNSAKNPGRKQIFAILIAAGFMFALTFIFLCLFPARGNRGNAEENLPESESAAQIESRENKTENENLEEDAARKNAKDLENFSKAFKSLSPELQDFVKDFVNEDIRRNLPKEKESPEKQGQ
ncbi:MAG: serine/threonine protein kinase [Opitutales bacterium]|nr:serine/threonine protein kinase [Opitutales bacterium]